MSEWCRNNMYIIDLLCVVAVVNLSADYNTPIVTINIYIFVVFKSTQRLLVDQV